MHYQFFTILIICLAINLACSSTAHSQNNGLKIGVEAQAMTQLAGTAPLRMSAGNSFGIWSEIVLNEQSALRISTVHRSLNGLQLSTNAQYNTFLPREFRRSLSTTMLNSLQYVDLSLSWCYKARNNAPWSVGLGVYGAYLHTWRGARQSSSWVHSERMRFWASSLSGGYGISGSSNIRPLKTTEEALPRTAFQTLDIGMQLRFHYRITRGLQLQCTYQQGFRNLVNETLFGQPTQFFASALAFGFSARIF